MDTAQMQPLKKNDRWKRDDKKPNEDSNEPRRFNRFNRGGGGGGDGSRRGGFGRDRGRGARRGEFGRESAFGRGRGYRRGNDRRRSGGRDNSFSRMRQKKPEFKYDENSFPTLGKTNEKTAASQEKSLDWRAAAQRGADAPPPKPRVKKSHEVTLKTLEKNIIEEDDCFTDDDCVFDDGDDVFPGKGGYLD